VAGGLSTYEQLWRAVNLRCPSASLFLSRQWIDFAFRSLWDRRMWSWQRKRSQFLTSALYNTGLVNVTRGSFTVEGVGTTFTSDMVGRQFRIGFQSPIYTIGAFIDTTHIDLTDVWGWSTTLSTGYSIYNAYVTAPSDCQSLISVWDPRYNWQLQLSVQQEELNAWDAQRANTGIAYVVASLHYDSTFNDPPLPMYEIWPHQRAEYVYPFLYVSRPPDLSEAGASLPRFIRGDVLLELALAQAARWPGPTKDARNPYFNLALAMQHDTRAEQMIRELEVTDDNILETDVTYLSLSSMPFATIPFGDARWLQAHDVG
jgi:hypothetical protein